MTKLKTNVRVDVITSNNSVSNVDLLVNFLSVNSRKAPEDIRQIAAGLLADVELSEVCNLSLNQLMNYGFSGKQAGALLSAFELFNRSISTPCQGMSVFSSEVISEYLIKKYGHERQEHLAVLYLNVQNRVIEERTVFVGGVNRSIASPREIIHHACKNMASRIIIVHNHPSGQVMPSKNDLTFTKQIKTACDTVGVDVLDHIIVGRDAYYSFREEGDLV